MPRPDTLHEIHRASDPYGVVTRDALRLSKHQLNRCCATGVLERRHPGVFVNPAMPRSALQDLAIAVAGARPWGAGWGRSAGWMWMVVDVPPPTPEVVVPWQRHPVLPGANVHRSRALDRSMVTTVNAIPVTKPLVTLLDLGVVLTAIEVADVIIRARQLRLFTPHDVDGILARLAKPGRTGVSTVRAARELIMIGDRPADSVLEFRFHRGPGRQLPPYSYQHDVRVGKRRYRIDFAYPDVMLAIEVDGFEKRMSPESLDHDDERSTALVLAGWTVIRFTFRQIERDPDGVAAAILEALGRLRRVSAR
jgi:very-short-patch-repair endonuclease